MAQEQEIDIRGWVVRILKNWYWFLLSCVVFGALGCYRYYSTPKKFQVDAKIMLRDNNAGGSSFLQSEVMSMFGVGGGGKSIVDEMEILTSRDAMGRIIADLDLRSEYRKKKGLMWLVQYPRRDFSVVYPPQYTDTLSRGVNIRVNVKKDGYVVKVKYGRWTKSSHKVADLTETIHTCAGPLSFELHANGKIEVGDKYAISTLPSLPLINMYKARITAATVKKESSVIEIKTTTDSPARSIAFIRKLIELYNLDAVMDKNIMASNTAAFIEERLSLITAELAQAEQNEVQYQEQHGIINLKTEAELFLAENVEYRKQWSDLETQLNLIHFVSEFVEDDANVNNLIPANLGIKDVALITLISEYNELMLKRMRIVRTAGEDNPVLDQMDEQLSLMRANVVATMSSVRETLLIAKRDLDTRFNAADKWRGDVPTQIKQYREVVRTKEMKEKLYLFLYEKREENALTLAATVNPAKVIAAPQMNPVPVGPKMKIIGLICLIFAFGVPFGIMLAYDIMNNRISHDHKDLERRLKIPFAGMLVKNHRGEHIAVREGENSVSAELFRTLRTNIRFMHPIDVTCPVILVTSSINGEGKSYVAANLAISMALLGKKVALVGLDIRKPMIATYMNLPTQGCLTSYLSDTAYELEDTIVSTSIANLDALPAGVVPPNPSELLQSERLDQLFAKLRERYDCVIIDSAPVALVSDTFLLNRVADMTVYVTRANYTTFDLIEFLNQVHFQQRLPKMAAVLNGVDANKVGYGYGYGYGHQSQIKKWWQLKKS